MRVLQVFKESKVGILLKSVVLRQHQTSNRFSSSADANSVDPIRSAGTWKAWYCGPPNISRGKSKAYHSELYFISFQLIMQYGALERSELSLPQSEDDSFESNIGNRRRRTLNGRTSAVIAVVIFVLASACVSNYKPINSKAYTIGAKVTTLVTDSQIGVTASNEYGIYNGPYPWLATAASQLVEPYKVTTLSVTGIDTADSSFYYKWTLPSNLTTASVDTRLNKCNITATEVGKYNIKVEAFDASDTLIASYSALLICKYVLFSTSTRRIVALDIFWCWTISWCEVFHVQKRALLQWIPTLLKAIESFLSSNNILIFSIIFFLILKVRETWDSILDDPWQRKILGCCLSALEI